MKKYYLTALVMLLLAGAAVILNQIVAGPLRSDQQKSDDLESLQSTIRSYIDEKGSAPASLSGLAIEPPLKDHLANYEYRSLFIPTPTPTPTVTPFSSRGVTIITNPVIQKPDTTTARYELCATFARDTLKTPSKATDYSEDFTHHGKGRYCFTEKQTVYSAD